MSGKKHGDKRKVEAISEDEKAKVKKEGSIPIIDDKTKMKRSSRNASEKRRRDKLNTYINELSAMVPSCSSPHSSRKLDKSTILKLTVSYMKLHADLLSPSPNESTVSWKPAFLSNEELATLMLEALDGFLFVLSVTGRVLYVSHTVAPLLGHMQNNLIGRSLFDLVHESDRGLLENTLKTHFNTEMSESSSSSGSKPKVSFSIKMLRGGMKSYELVHCSGNVRRWEDAIKNPNQDGMSEIASLSQGLLETEDNPTHCLVAVGKMEAPKIIRDISSLDQGKNEYLSRHSLEAKYLYVDNKAPSIIGYLPSEIIGCSAYDFYHLDDLSILSVNHKNLMNHGNSVTMFYRFLTKGQQWIWMQTHGFVEKNKWTNKPETIICHNVVVSYSKVLEYLQTRALEYGPALPPIAITRSNSCSPHEALINCLTGTRGKGPQPLPDDRICDITPGIHKEEPPSPPNISPPNINVAITGQHFTTIPPIPNNLYPRTSNSLPQQQPATLYQVVENVPAEATQNGQGYTKMDVLSPGSVQDGEHVIHDQPLQQLQHLNVHRGPVINIPHHQQQQPPPQQQPQQVRHVTQHVQHLPQPMPGQPKHHQIDHVAAGQAPSAPRHIVQHQDHHHVPVTTNAPQTVHHHVHSVSNGQITHGVQQIHLHHQSAVQNNNNNLPTNGQPSPLQQAQQQAQHGQPNQLITQSLQQGIVQHHGGMSQPSPAARPVPTTQHFSQPATPDKHVNSPVTHHHSNPATSHHITTTHHQPSPQPPRHASPQVVLLPAGQHGYITNQTQLRPTINLQGMQYINVNSTGGVEETTTTTQAVLSPGTPATPRPTTQQEYTTVKPGNMAHYTAPAMNQAQYSIIPTSGSGIQVPNSNVIMIQPVAAAGGGTQYQLAQLYPLIHAVSPTNGTLTAAFPHKLAPQNGTQIDLTKTATSTCYSLPVKRESTRCEKSPNTPLNAAQCASADKAVFRSSSEDYNLSSAGSDHVLDHFDPEVISMILNNTNIDNFNLDNQWNHNLFDNPPNSTHSNSSNPSPISAHSPGT